MMTILFQKMREIPLLVNVLYVGENKVSVAKIITKCSQLRNPRPFPQVSAIGGLLFIAIGLTQNAFRIHARESAKRSSDIVRFAMYA